MYKHAICERNLQEDNQKHILNYLGGLSHAEGGNACYTCADKAAKTHLKIKIFWELSLLTLVYKMHKRPHATSVRGA
jgi:hypothetical protein